MKCMDQLAIGLKDRDQVANKAKNIILQNSKIFLTPPPFLKMEKEKDGTHHKFIDLNYYEL